MGLDSENKKTNSDLKLIKLMYFVNKLHYRKKVIFKCLLVFYRFFVATIGELNRCSKLKKIYSKSKVCCSLQKCFFIS